MFSDFFNRKKILFLFIFAILSFVAFHINVAQIVGIDNQFFTLFQMIGPLPGIFLGPFVGIAAVLIAQITNYFFLGRAFDVIGIARLLPMLFAVYYFGTSKNDLKKIGAPIAAILAFVTHPVGMQAWFFSLFWLIPVFVIFSDNLFLKSLGTTFTAHAVGGAVWIHTFPTTPEFWTALIPVVATERLLFAVGIAASFVILNTVLNKVESVLNTGVLNIDKKYVLSKKLFRLNA